MKKILYLILFIALMPAQVATDLAFPSAESAALAGSGVANPGSAASLFQNPAALVEMDDTYLTLGSTRFHDLNVTSLGLVVETPDWGPVGIVSQMSKTKVEGTTLSEENSVGITGAFYLLDDQHSKLMMGYALNYLSWSLGRTAGVSGDGSDGLSSSSGSAFGVDVGIQAVLRGKHRVGAYFKNINSPTVGESEPQHLPRRMSIGVAYNPYHPLITSLAIERLFGRDDIQIKGGISYQFTNAFQLRLGIQSNPNRFGSGFQFASGRFKLDYGLLTHPVWPMEHYFTLGYRF